MVRQERDTNGDGKVDEWEYYGAASWIGLATTPPATGR